MKNMDFWDNPLIQPIVEWLFGNTIPIWPHPRIEPCLGLKAKNSTMTIHEGYAVMSVDYNVSASHKDCLFRLDDWKKELAAQQKAR